ncbi:hypothetical protein BU17DRAFT_62625 [Hysterangium stoloniferum]|nr:hypothetical protein BU17DRAFT_62625 [Hysterangium stoloniferum]
MINKKRNSSSTRSYTPENPPTTLRSEQFESSVSRSFSQLAVGFRASTSIAPTPLGQLQNIQGPVKSTQLKIGAVVPTPSEQNHLHSYRRRLKVLSVRALHLNAPGLVVASPSHADPDPDANMFLDDGIDVEAGKHRLDNDSRAACDETNPPPAASAQPSPSKMHADSGGDLSDVPKMDSPESDESGLELELDTIVKGLDARWTGVSASAHTSTFNEVNTRQSTRHLPNRDVKVKLFRDDSPGPSTPRTTFKPKPKSNVACPLDTLLKDNRREEACKGRVEGKRGYKGGCWDVMIVLVTG